MPRADIETYRDLRIQYVDGTLHDPETGTDQKVRLRGYVDANLSPNLARPNGSFVAPLLDVQPGDTIRISLDNALPANNKACDDPKTLPDQPGCYNKTNLHSHGLWVSPAGNSDNVLLSIDPGVKFQYEYNLPADHPAGTFWYHTHQHGSTAVQVGSGMAGALIVRGNRVPTPERNGDLDTLLKRKENGYRNSLDEQTLVFTQIPYACKFDANGQVKKRDAENNIDWSCGPGETGMIEDIGVFGPGKWADSGRWTTINGVVLPTIRTRGDDVERWRLIDAGVVETVKFQIRKATSQDALRQLKQGFKRADLSRLVNEACGGKPLDYLVVAADGLTLNQTITTTAVTMQPGYRYDALVMFPEAGDYCIVQPAVPKGGTVSEAKAAPTLLGFVDVTVGNKNVNPSMTVIENITNHLVSVAIRTLLNDVRDLVLKELLYKSDGKAWTPRLTRYVPHKPVSKEEVANVPRQEMVFFLSSPTPQTGPFEFSVGNSFKIVNDKGYLRPDGATGYDPKRIDRNLVLGQAQEWELRSYSVSHPFHIHVNPFQVISVVAVTKDANGKLVDGPDISLPGAVDTDGDDQYAGLHDAWKDTLWVKTKLFPGYLTDPPVDYYKITVRTRYERYIGEFVLHCHILDHEDEGMMQNVQISVPNRSGGPSAGMVGMAHGHN